MENKKNIIWFFIIVAIIIGVCYGLSTKRHKEEAKKEETRQEKISEKTTIVQNLANKYQTKIGDGEELIYTIEAQEEYISGYNSDSPILFTDVYLDDIYYNRDEQIFIRFSSGLFSRNKYILELEGNEETVKKLLAQKIDKDVFTLYGEYAVVAKIQEITKPVFALKGSGLLEDEVEIEITDSNLFIAKGVCLDAVYIAD